MAAYVMKGKYKSKAFLSFGISSVIILLLLSAIDVDHIFTALLQVNGFFYLLGFLAYVTSYILRALRFRVLFKTNTLGQYVLIVAGHMFFNHILPFRSGELSLPFFLKRITNIPYSQSISLFMLLRLFDVIVIIITFFTVLLWGGDSPNIQILTFSLLILILCIIGLLNLKTLFLKIITYITYILPEKYTPHLKEFEIHINQALTLSPKVHIQLFLLSLLDRICNYAVTIFLVKGMSFDISFVPLIIANAAASLSNVLPINSIGSFGTLELGWTGALMYYDIPKDIAISSGFSFHLLFITYTIGIGLTSLFMMKIKYNINPFVQKNS